jgi:hypothetical protein
VVGMIGIGDGELPQPSEMSLDQVHPPPAAWGSTARPRVSSPAEDVGGLRRLDLGRSPCMRLVGAAFGCIEGFGAFGVTAFEVCIRPAQATFGQAYVTHATLD